MATTLEAGLQLGCKLADDPIVITVAERFIINLLQPVDTVWRQPACNQPAALP